MVIQEATTSAELFMQFFMHLDIMYFLCNILFIGLYINMLSVDNSLMINGIIRKKHHFSNFSTHRCLKLIKNRVIIAASWIMAFIFHLRIHCTGDWSAIDSALTVQCTDSISSF